MPYHPRFRRALVWIGGGMLTLDGILASLYFGVSGFATSSLKYWIVGLTCGWFICGIWWVMGKDQEPSGHISESAQSRATVTGSTISGSKIDASITTHHHNKGIAGKYIALIVLALLILAGAYLYFHRHDGRLPKNGNATASGTGSTAISGDGNNAK
jgi:Na+-driven multidrug efflux pump